MECLWNDLLPKGNRMKLWEFFVIAISFCISPVLGLGMFFVWLIKEPKEEGKDGKTS